MHDDAKAPHAMMDLQHWRVLVAVADSGRVTRAAEQCGVSASAASQAISHLEQALGAPLLQRDRRRAALTALGEDVVAGARQMLSVFDGIRQQAAQRLGLHHGVIHLAAFDHPVMRALAEPLAHFRALHPQVEIVELRGEAGQMNTWLAHGSADLALCVDAAAPGLVLGKDEWLAVVPSGHPLARRDRETRVRLGELAPLPFVLAQAEQVRPLFARAGLALTHVQVQVRDWHGALDAVRQGQGVSLLPASSLPAERNGLMVFGLAPVLARRFSLQPRAGAQPAVAVLLDYLQGRANG